MVYSKGEWCWVKLVVSGKGFSFFGYDAFCLEREKNYFNFVVVLWLLNGYIKWYRILRNSLN